MHYGATHYASSASGGSDAEIIHRFSHVVRRAAHHLAARTGVSSEDLWSAGALGLLEAVRRFEASRGVKLEVFVAYRVRGAMLDELRRMDRLPRRLRGRISEIERVKRGLAQELGRAPTREEIAKAAGVEPADVDRAAEAGEAMASLDAAAPIATDETALDELVVSKQQAAELKAAVANLPERQRHVLAMRYQEELTLKEIAGVLGVSEPRVCQIHNAAVLKLRAALVR